MKEKNIELTNAIMREIGLDVNSLHQVIDQDTNEVLSFNGKTMVYNLDPVRNRLKRHDIEFNPLENLKMMSQLFSYYVNKLNREEGLYISLFYPVVNQHTGVGYLVAKDGQNNTIQSGSYSSDCLKYADLIFRLSGETNVNLSRWDEGVS